MLSINFSKNEHAHHKGKWFVKRSPLSTNIVGPSIKHVIAAGLWIKLRWYECDVLHIAETQNLAWILRFGMLNIFFHLPLQVHFFLPCYKPRGFHQGVPLTPDFPLVQTMEGSSKRVRSRRKVKSELILQLPFWWSFFPVIWLLPLLKATAPVG